MPMRTMIACNKLFEQGVYVNPVIPPATPIGECLIRTSYTATQIDQPSNEIDNGVKIRYS